ncbi:hypothetical protein [Microcoleus sp.]|uniref:hypothetical protein n=1 Tax=Microcoleus sp. TaxID=44472 RepID=UPI00403E506A
MQLAPFEEKMWNSWSPNTPDHPRFDRDTYQRYDFKETPIVTEINREKLPRFVESLKLSNYIEMRSFYQRRGREHPGFAKTSNGQEVVEVSTTKF